MCSTKFLSAIFTPKKGYDDSPKKTDDYAMIVKILNVWFSIVRHRVATILGISSREKTQQMSYALIWEIKPLMLNHIWICYTW